MLSRSEIIERMNLKRSSTDLGLIYDIWEGDESDAEMLLSCEQIAVRKAVVALESVATTLTHSLSDIANISHRTLPEISQSTRLRKIPERFWLEIDCDPSSATQSERAVVFVEFSPKQAKVGVRLPADPNSSEANALSDLDFLGNLKDSGNSSWTVEQSRPPAESRACSSDLNAWLSGRAAAKHKDDFFTTLSKVHSGGQLRLEDLLESVKSAALLCEKINAQPPHLYQATPQVERSSLFL